ncbi:MAG: small subunit ribosomal protein [Thermotogota bacterium]|nr:small subunit ribosomal protein [Thermotogota bacterium]MDK2864731.1 small subunit ribosomal protein [Thermotogota bacterium]
MERIYETMFIVDPNLPDEEREGIVEKVKAWIEERVGGKIDSLDRMGKRKLAFKVKRFTEGDYTVIIFRASPESVGELERFYHFTPEIFRWQTFRRLDLEKKEAKAKKDSTSSSVSTDEAEVKVEE